MKLGMARVDPEKEEFDVGIVASYGKFIRRRIIERAKVGMLNVHPSLLPQWRGPAPIQRSLMSGTPLGVSIISVHPRIIDGGDIYSQARLVNEDMLSYSEASEELAVLGAEQVVRVLDEFENIKPKPQSSLQEDTTYAGFITSRDSAQSLERQSALQIYRIFLAISHQETLHCKLPNGKELLLKEIVGYDDQYLLDPGHFAYDKFQKLFFLGTSRGSLKVKKGILKGKSTLLDAGGIYSALQKPPSQ
jgi:methionyl-tRNA formyltransferase